MFELIIAAGAGLGAGAACAWWAWRRGQQATASVHAALAAATSASDAQGSRIGELEQLLAEQQARLDAARHALQGGLQSLGWERDQLAERANAVVEAAARAAGHTGALSTAIEDLLRLSKTFERWHASMDALLQHNADMHRKNEDFARIVRQMTIVTLNASIEAARAGNTGAGFAVVATEMRELAGNAQTLSSEYRNSLYENDLLTTTTFQDLQATGKLIMGAVVGLNLVNRKAHEALAQAHEETTA